MPIDVKQRLVAYVQLMRIDKPIGFLLLWWPVMWALLFAAGEHFPSVKNIVIFTLGAWIMRAAGCVINDIADRHIDKHVQRTRARPLTTGRVSLGEALCLFVLLCALALLLVFQLSPKVQWLSLVALALASLYPFTKRWFYCPQFFLGAAFSWGTVMAYVEQSGQFDVSCALLFVSVVLWTVAYDTFYGMVDMDDDILIGVKSTALWFADKALYICIVCMLSSVLIWIFLGVYHQFAWPYYAAIAISFLFFCWQWYLVSTGDRDNYFRAFLNNRFVGLTMCVGLIVNQLYMM